MPAQPYPPPSSWMKKPGLFGKGTGSPEWARATTDREAVLIRAARFQHQLARVLRERIEDDQTSAAAVAAAIGISPDMLNDALNGHTHLHVTTVDAIHHVLGLKTKIVVEPGRRPRPNA